MQAKAKQIDGKTLVIEGVAYVIPPMNFSAIRKFGELISAKDIDGEEKNPFAAMVRRMPLIHAAFSRNYDCTLEEVEDIVDLKNFNAVLEAVMSVSDMKPVVGGDVAGEQPPVQ